MKVLSCILLVSRGYAEPGMGTQDTSWTVPPEVETALANDAQVRALRQSTAFTSSCSLGQSSQCHQHSSKLGSVWCRSRRA